MDSFLDILKKQDNLLLKNESKGIELFNNLKHDKASLKLFLTNTVAEILTTSKKRLICSSNEELVKKFSSAKNKGMVLEKPIIKPFDVSNKYNVLTWDLLKNKYASIAGDKWVILNFILIDKENIDVLYKVIIDLLRKTDI